MCQIRDKVYTLFQLWTTKKHPTKYHVAFFATIEWWRYATCQFLPALRVPPVHVNVFNVQLRTFTCTATLIESITAPTVPFPFRWISAPSKPPARLGSAVTSNHCHHSSGRALYSYNTLWIGVCFQKRCPLYWHCNRLRSSVNRGPLPISFWHSINSYWTNHMVQQL